MENHSDISKNFISYELALALKDLGFDEPCFGFYVNNKVKYGIASVDKNINKCWIDELFCTAPTFSQAFRFFREKYGLHYIICKNIQMDGYGYREVILIPYMEENKNTIFKTYEEAELACIRKLIEIAKEQNVK